MSDDEREKDSGPRKSVEDQLEKLPYPKSVFFIVSNEFCERFSYYGMRTILSIYLTNMLLYSESDTKIIYHTFTMLVYFFPIFGAMLADSLLGKFKTIFYLSIVYAIGNIVLALAATPTLELPAAEISMVGLLLIAMGTGGIKPCVSAFGGDQFQLPQQESQLVKFFSMFYFSINAGSLISTFITPILRERECLGSEECYTLAFGVPGALMIVSIVIFGLGKKLYRIRQPEGNMVIKVSQTIGHALKVRRKATIKNKNHWLDYAEEKYGKKLVSEVKATLKVLFLYLPLPVFWALFDQQGTAWTFQAKRMDGDVGFYTILPDQMQVVNPLLILAFIPLFEYVFYPIMNKLHILRSPLQRLVAGGILAAVAFAVSAGISLAIEAEEPLLPKAGFGQVRIYNNFDCEMSLKSDFAENLKVPALQFAQYEVKVSGSKNYPFTNGNPNCGPASGVITFIEEKTTGFYFRDNDIFEFEDSISKGDKGLPKIRTLVNGAATPIKIMYISDGGHTAIDTNSSDFAFKDIKPELYTIHIGDKYTKHDVTFKLGGVYSVLVNYVDETTVDINIAVVTKPNGIHMLLLIPQYVIITMAEIMFSITGLEFSYSQAPNSMKSVLQACWLLTTAFGNLIIVIIESVEIFEKQSYTYFLYAGLMVVDMLIFALMAMKYEYVEKDDGEDDSMDLEPTDIKGIENAAYATKDN